MRVRDLAPPLLALGAALAAAPAGAQEVPAPAVDLTTRYRFSETYIPQGAAAAPGLIGAYRVAYKLSETRVTDEPSGAPKRTETSQQVVYTERPAQPAGGDGRLADVVRRYEAVRVTPDVFGRPGQPRTLEGATIWMHQAPEDETPTLICMTPGRGLTDPEARLATSGISAPELALLLPPAPQRVGDTWRISREGCEALLGVVVREGSLVAKLAEVRPPAAESPNRVAVIDLSGKLNAEGAAITVRAQLQFSFPAGVPTAEDAVVEARGAIAKLSLGQNSTTLLEGGGRRQVNRRRELILERKLGEGADLVIPAAMPASTPENSWLTYVDPAGRFSFRHPQALRIESNPGPDAVFLGQFRPEGPDAMRLDYVPQPARKPDEDYFKGMLVKFRAVDLEILPGATQKLPEADWAGALVTRTEAALKVGGRRPTRLHLYGYVFHFSRNVALVVEATTLQEAPTAFRKDIEAVLKTFKLGPPPAAK